MNKIINPPKYLSKEEIKKLLDNSSLIILRRKSLKPIYIHLSICLGLYAGLRVSEMIKLTPEDVIIDDDIQEITVNNSKYNRTRRIPILEPLVSLLKYLNLGDSL